jgi:hypothetical protein
MYKKPIRQDDLYIQNAHPARIKGKINNLIKSEKHHKFQAVK